MRRRKFGHNRALTVLWSSSEIQFVLTKKILTSFRNAKKENRDTIAHLDCFFISLFGFYSRILNETGKPFFMQKKYGFIKENLTSFKTTSIDFIRRGDETQIFCI